MSGYTIIGCHSNEHQSEETEVPQVSQLNQLWEQKAGVIWKCKEL